MKRILVVSTAMLVVVFHSASIQAVPPDPTPGATKPVREQNLDDNGWIAVHEQGTANVEVQGTADVHVTGGEIDADVTIINDVSSPVPVTGEVELTGSPSVHVIDGRVPFLATLQCDPPSCGDQVIHRSPDYQICVIEYFSCIANVPDSSNTALICQIQTGVDGVWSQFNLNVTPFATARHTYLSAGEMVKLYASPNTGITVDGFLTGGFATFSDLWVSISGYCVDVDTP